jgi:hypothetical protein
MKKVDKNRPCADAPVGARVAFILMLLLPTALHAQEEQLTFIFYCEHGSTTLIRSEANATMRSQLHHTLCDTSLIIHSARLFATASIEGNYYDNGLLAQQRVSALRRRLEELYQLSARMSVSSHWTAENWDDLAYSIAHSNIPHREEALHIIKHTAITQGREYQLMKLAGGEPYRQMKSRFFQGLRQMRVTLTFRRKHLPAQTSEPLHGDRASTNRNSTDTPLSLPTAAARFRPRLLIKSNLLAWAGITPEIAYRTPMPNLELEWMWNKHFSLSAAALYQRDVGRAEGYEVYHVTAYTLEMRYRPLPTLRHPGCYTGIYLRAGDYNMRTLPTVGTTGRYYEGGLSMGYTVALSAHWLLEGGLSAGYRYVQVKKYLHDAGGDQPTQRGHTDAFTLTNISLTIGYRL